MINIRNFKSDSQLVVHAPELVDRMLLIFAQLIKIKLTKV